MINLLLSAHMRPYAYREKQFLDRLYLPTSGMNTGTQSEADAINRTILIKDSTVLNPHNNLNSDEPIIIATCITGRKRH